MRKQIRGLTQASANAEDGISTVQTAEGALAEVQDMLQRINELAVKSANGTNSDTDRSYIQNEVDQLVTEIDRVAQTTKFNETYLLKGNSSLPKGYSLGYNVAKTASTATASFDKYTASIASVGVTFADPTTIKNATANELVKSMRDQGLTLTTTGDGAGGHVTQLQLNGDAASNYKVVTTSSDCTKYLITDLNNITVCSVNVGKGTMDGSATLLAKKDTIRAQQSTKELQEFYDKDGNAVSANALENYFDVNNGNVYVKADCGTLYDAVGKAYTKGDLTTKVNTTNKEVIATKDQTAALNVKFQVGADTSSSNKISINIESMSAKGLGLNGLKVSTTNTADSAVNTVSAALQKVSRQRSTLGAIQNRLEHTINNLDNVVENTTSAESAIRDTDMATEMVTYSNSNILAQAGQAMLAQANQSNQGVLTLLG
jgi:flagellin